LLTMDFNNSSFPPLAESDLTDGRGGNVSLGTFLITNFKSRYKHFFYYLLVQKYVLITLMIDIVSFPLYIL